MKYIKSWFIFGVLVMGIIYPIFLVWDFVSPWEEGVSYIESMHPNQVLISTSSETQWSSGGLAYKRQRYLLLPKNLSVTLLKEKNQDLRYTERSGGLISFLIFIVILYALWFWLCLPRIRNTIKLYRNKEQRAAHLAQRTAKERKMKQSKNPKEDNPNSW